MSAYTQHTSLLDAVRVAFKAFKEKCQINEDIREKANIAKVFNARYTYRVRLIEECDILPSIDLPPGAKSLYSPKGGYAWMCPDCNKVHMAISWNNLTGLEYPPCCRTTTKSPRDI